MFPLKNENMAFFVWHKVEILKVKKSIFLGGGGG